MQETGQNPSEVIVEMIEILGARFRIGDRTHALSDACPFRERTSTSQGHAALARPWRESAPTCSPGLAADWPGAFGRASSVSTFPGRRPPQRRQGPGGALAEVALLPVAPPPFTTPARPRATNAPRESRMQRHLRRRNAPHRQGRDARSDCDLTELREAAEPVSSRSCWLHTIETKRRTASPSQEPRLRCSGTPGGPRPLAPAHEPAAGVGRDESDYSSPPPGGPDSTHLHTHPHHKEAALLTLPFGPFRYLLGRSLLVCLRFPKFRRQKRDQTHHPRETTVSCEKGPPRSFFFLFSFLLRVEGSWRGRQAGRTILLVLSPLIY